MEAIDDLILGNSGLTGGSAGGDQSDISRVGPTVDVLPSTETGNPIDDSPLPFSFLSFSGGWTISSIGLPVSVDGRTSTVRPTRPMSA